MRQTPFVVSIAGFVLAACASQSVELADDSLPPPPIELTQETILEAQRAGYMLVTKNGEQVFCRRDAQTGSRLQHTTTCLTARDWARVRSTSREALQDMTEGHQPKRDDR